MKLGNAVILCHGTDTAEVIVGGISDDGNHMRLSIASPPEWYRRLERKRGLFSAQLDVLLFVFKDHKGEWTDSNSLDHFTINKGEPMTHKIIVDEQGMLRCLHNPVVPMHELGSVTRTRISHIVPLWLPKRAVFRLMRLMFGERGRVADWTRSWRGPWHVSIVATGAWSVFDKRADCVAWEVQQINDNPAKFDL